MAIRKSLHFSIYWIFRKLIHKFQFPFLETVGSLLSLPAFRPRRLLLPFSPSSGHGEPPLRAARLRLDYLQLLDVVVSTGTGRKPVNPRESDPSSKPSQRRYLSIPTTNLQVSWLVELASTFWSSSEKDRTWSERFHVRRSSPDSGNFPPPPKLLICISRAIELRFEWFLNQWVRLEFINNSTEGIEAWNWSFDVEIKPCRILQIFAGFWKFSGHLDCSR